eukprot:g35795.t1
MEDQHLIFRLGTLQPSETQQRPSEIEQAGHVPQRSGASTGRVPERNGASTGRVPEQSEHGPCPGAERAQPESLSRMLRAHAMSLSGASTGRVPERNGASTGRVPEWNGASTGRIPEWSEHRPSPGVERVQV